MNYLPQAMALLESTRKVYPEIDFYVLIIDGTSKDIPHLPSAKILHPEDLNISPGWLKEMRSYYDAMELSTSLKPFLLDTLLTEGVSTVTFLDPDILLFGELTDGMEAAEDFGIALTPHRLTPSNILKPGYSELAFLQYGIFNLGYIVVGQKSKQMLAWWGERLRWYCTKFPSDAVFTDQKWINFIPALFDFKCIKNYGYNLASWNIDERPITLVNQKLYAGNDELVFIHFSQMSGVLAAGKTTDHWEKSLDQSAESRNSLVMISEITNNYSRKLVDYRLLLGNVQNPTKKGIRLSYHSKKERIRKSIIASQNQNGHEVSYVHFPARRSPFQNISLLLERSTTLNGFRDGSAEDFRKFLKKFQNACKK